MFTFINTAGATLFIRDDAERAEWTQEEMTLNAEFPYNANKVISIGQRVCFADPATGAIQIYEVKQAKTLEPDAVQQVIAEHICISELSDEHIDGKEITNKACSAALSGVLSGTLWTVGEISVNPSSSVDISRGSVWQAVLQIKENWNVYIVPRVTLAADGTISRNLDIKSTDGEWNGLRLSIDKNFLDPSVTYDDSELVTALYGYGGQDDDGNEITFSDVVWQSTAAHPAKPKGQKYLEDPAATAAYGRNGRARFGYYQNSDITNPETLLKKTWETLKTISKPAISIEGTIADLYRMGYADTPIRLHDIALVEVLPAGFVKQIQIIRLTTDLLNPTSTTVTIGSYIKNIIYIDRSTNQAATGSRGGGGGNSNNTENKWQEYRTTIKKLANDTGLEIAAVKNDINNQEKEIETMSGRITVMYDKISLVVKETKDGNEIDAASIVLGINNQSGSYVKISAKTVDLGAYATVRELNATKATIDNLTTGKTTAGALMARAIYATLGFTYQGHAVSFRPITINGTEYHLLGY